MKPTSTLRRYAAMLAIVPVTMTVACSRHSPPEPAATMHKATEDPPGVTQVAESVPQSGKAEVTIDNFTFNPKAITVAKGTTVQWTNRDDIPHVVASADDKFKKSQPLDTGQSFSYTFTESGTYNYFCTIHPTMTGTVLVQ